MKSVYFLSLNALNFIPYAYGMLQSYANLTEDLKNGYQWEVPLCRIDPPSVVLQKIVDPDVLLASCYVWNHNQHAAIAKAVKEKYPDCRVVFGGPHVPDESGRYFSQHPYVDVLVHGEGELPLKALLLAFLQDEPDLGSIPGISYNVKGHAVKTPPGHSLPKDIPVPSPYTTGLLDYFFQDERPNKIVLWETNRGCPYACTFCDWGVRTMNKLRFHDMDKVKKEIDCIARQGIEDVYVTDCNFGLFERDLQIARWLADARKTHGYPKRVRIQFAKLSNDNIFEISKILHENEMLWGTTLSMQSVDESVLKVINRKHMGLENYRKLEARYDMAGIPTYTELIIGLPLESKKSFIEGICKLFEIGLHNDIRVFELTILPNAPLGRRSEREKYGLQTQFRPLRQNQPEIPQEYVELVFGTNTMPYKDWKFSLLFGETAQALHNGGYTRFLSIFLNQHNLLPYKTFYEGLLTFLLNANTASGNAFKRVERLVDDFANDPDMPQIHRLLSQPDMVAFLDSYNPKRKGWPIWTFLWLSLSEAIDAFYRDVTRYLETQGISMDAMLADLIRYQQEIMLTLEYDPERGKEVQYAYNWFEHFFTDTPLKEIKTALKYQDKRMGISHRYAIQKGDRISFVRAAIGMSYPYSKFRHFFHQPDQTCRIA
mgnify:CR=1 FL=1